VRARSEPVLVNDGGWHHVISVVDRMYGFYTYIDGTLQMYTTGSLVR
jgi:hypothetical protein